MSVKRPSNDMTKLPAWARSYIEQLESKVASLTLLNDEQLYGNSDATDFGYTEIRRDDFRSVFMLPKYAGLMAFPKDELYTLRLSVEEHRPHALYVHSTRGYRIIVLPHAANAVSIEAVP